MNSSQFQEKLTYSTGCFYELTKWLAVLVIALTLVHFFVATVFIIEGISMEPDFFNGEAIIANRFQYTFSKPDHGDVAMLKFPGDPEHKKYIKRIVGLPDDTIEIKNGAAILNGKTISEPYLSTGVKTLPDMQITLKDDEYFLMGDNRPNSNDSRVWGVANKRHLIGKAWFVIWPTTDFGKVKKYSY